MLLKFDFTADEIVSKGTVAQKDIDDIKMWIFREKLPKLTDEQIVLFLISKDCDTKQTKQTILSFFKYTSSGPNIFNDRDANSKEMSQQISVVESCVIPKRTKDDHMVIYQRLRNFSPWNFNLEISLKYFFMLLNVGLKSGLPPKGVIVLLDMHGVGLLHLTKLRVGPLKILFGFIQDGLPCQIVAIHVLNSTYFVDKMIAIIKPLMKKELFDKLHFHNADLDMKEFFDTKIEADCIPSDYGGNLHSIKHLEEITLKEMKQMTEWFEIEEKIRTSVVSSKT